MNTILEYAQRNRDSFEMGGVSSNEIRFFTYEEKRYILKTPLMTRDDFSPFWTMMRRVFGYSVREQNANLHNISNTSENLQLTKKGINPNDVKKLSDRIAVIEDNLRILTNEMHGLIEAVRGLSDT
jgi:hypothetical protein